MGCFHVSFLVSLILTFFFLKYQSDYWISDGKIFKQSRREFGFGKKIKVTQNVNLLSSLLR